MFLAIDMFGRGGRGGRGGGGGGGDRTALVGQGMMVQTNVFNLRFKQPECPHMIWYMYQVHIFRCAMSVPMRKMRLLSVRKVVPPLRRHRTSGGDLKDDRPPLQERLRPLFRENRDKSSHLTCQIVEKCQVKLWNHPEHA